MLNTGQLDTVVLLLVDVIGSIVISLSHCCLQNDEGPAPPPKYFQCPCISQQLLCHLHWPPAHSRIDYKLATLTYEALTFNQPPYLSHFVTPYSPASILRSPDKRTLAVSLQLVPSQAVEDSLMLHFQYGIKFPFNAFKRLLNTCLPLAPSHHLPPSDCPCLGFGPCNRLCAHYKCCRRNELTTIYIQSLFFFAELPS